MKHCSTVLLKAIVILCTGLSLEQNYADVIIMKDGNILNGKITKKTKDSITFSNTYGDFTISLNKIKEKVITSSAAEDVKVYKSKGIVVQIDQVMKNYAEGQKKVDKQQNSDKPGTQVAPRKLIHSVSFLGGSRIPLGNTSDFFQNGTNIELTLRLNSSIFRGFSYSLTSGFSLNQNIESGDDNLLIIPFLIMPGYHLSLSTNRIIPVPFIALGFGLAYLTYSDSSRNFSNTTVDPVASVRGGLEVILFGNILVALEGGYQYFIEQTYIDYFIFWGSRRLSLLTSYYCLAN